MIFDKCDAEIVARNVRHSPSTAMCPGCGERAAEIMLLGTISLDGLRYWQPDAVRKLETHRKKMEKLVIQTITARLVGERISELGFVYSPSADWWYHPRGFRLEQIGTAYRLERPGTDRVKHIATRARRPEAIAEDVAEQLKQAMEAI